MPELGDASEQIVRVLLAGLYETNPRMKRDWYCEYLNLSYEYPRLNGWTEWFAVDPEACYEVMRSIGQAREGHQGTKLIHDA